MTRYRPKKAEKGNKTSHSQYRNNSKDEVLRPPKVHTKPKSKKGNVSGTSPIKIGVNAD